MDISVIIVSYNTAELTIACLESVFKTKHVSYEIFVVDNASKDGSAKLIREKFPFVRLIANEENRGFGAANNQALHECTGRYVVFLNPDTTVEPETFHTMTTFMGKHLEVGLAGPRVLNPDGSRQDSVSMKYPGHKYGARDLGSLPGNIACVMGACQIASASLLPELGGFDEDFFLYGEDQDLCLRVRQRGFEIGLIDDAVIMHHGGQSERNTLPAEVVRKKIRAELLFYRKHYLPDTIRRICNRQRLRALWRMFAIRLLLPLALDKKSALDKLSRYQVIFEESRLMHTREEVNQTKQACLACGAMESEWLFTQKGWTIHKCCLCGLGFIDPCPSQEELEALYRDSYFVAHYDEGMLPGTEAMRKRLSQEGHRIKFFKPFKKNGRILDIGCGRGYFLMACRERGFDVQGFDVSEDGATYIRETLGIPVHTGIPEGAFEDSSFDVITLWHSLEHTSDPAKYLELVGRWLRPDGVLIIDVPNYSGTDARLKGEAWEDWDLPYHLFHFTPKSLDTILQRHGFVVIKRKTYHSGVVKEKLRKIPLLGLIARPLAKLFSGSSYAIVAKKIKQDGKVIS